MTPSGRERRLWETTLLGLITVPLSGCAAFQAYGTHTYFAGTCANGLAVRLTHDFHRDALKTGSADNYADLWLWTAEPGQAERSTRVAHVSGSYSEHPRIVLGPITGYADNDCGRIWLVDDDTGRVVCAADLATSSVQGLADTKPAWADPKGDAAQRLRKTDDAQAGSSQP
jgi:hypothetical protein